MGAATEQERQQIRECVAAGGPFFQEGPDESGTWTVWQYTPEAFAVREAWQECATAEEAAALAESMNYAYFGGR